MMFNLLLFALLAVNNFMSVRATLTYPPNYTFYANCDASWATSRICTASGKPSNYVNMCSANCGEGPCSTYSDVPTKVRGSVISLIASWLANTISSGPYYNSVATAFNNNCQISSYTPNAILAFLTAHGAIDGNCNIPLFTTLSSLLNTCSAGSGFTVEVRNLQLPGSDVCSLSSFDNIIMFPVGEAGRWVQLLHGGATYPGDSYTCTNSAAYTAAGFPALNEGTQLRVFDPSAGATSSGAALIKVVADTDNLLGNGNYVRIQFLFNIF